MAKEKVVRTDSAMHGKTWNGKKSWSRVEDISEYKDTHGQIDWTDHNTSDTLEVIKSEGKTTYKVKI